MDHDSDIIPGSDSASMAQQFQNTPTTKGQSELENNIYYTYQATKLVLTYLLLVIYLDLQGL
jgi:hypothetical protein